MLRRKIQGWKVAEKRGKKSNRIPPFAPSKNELKVYVDHIKLVAGNDSLPKRALILGATPELRDAAIKTGLESYAVDVSQGMMNKFSALMKFKDSRLDRRMIKNWLAMDFPENYFGIVLGDASLTNLATRKENEQLVRICSRILKKGGYLTLRQAIYGGQVKPRRINKLIKDFHGNKISWADFFMELRFLTFKQSVYDKKTFRYDAGRNFKKIDELLKNKLLNEDEYGRINTFRNNIINTVYPAEEFIKMVENNGFKLIKEYHDKSFKFSAYAYLLVFKKL